MSVINEVSHVLMWPYVVSAALASLIQAPVAALSSDLLAGVKPPANGHVNSSRSVLRRHPNALDAAPALAATALRPRFSAPYPTPAPPWLRLRAPPAKSPGPMPKIGAARPGGGTHGDGEANKKKRIAHAQKAALEEKRKSKQAGPKKKKRKIIA